ncbi:hypothetical protein [Noviherbaspirillum sp.]|uniref:hypothetical protein n=1 Tax=Noviherbaspirillum sp. TaxID=1926288 RepID=UPI002B4A7CBF|nr:hypothetical protein [Noviherbaspirillum sp.]
MDNDPEPRQTTLPHAESHGRQLSGSFSNRGRERFHFFKNFGRTAPPVKDRAATIGIQAAACQGEKVHNPPYDPTRVQVYIDTISRGLNASNEQIEALIRLSTDVRLAIMRGQTLDPETTKAWRDATSANVGVQRNIAMFLKLVERTQGELAKSENNFEIKNKIFSRLENLTQPIATIDEQAVSITTAGEGLSRLLGKFSDEQFETWKEKLWESQAFARDAVEAFKSWRGNVAVASGRSHEALNPELFAQFTASMDSVARELDYAALSSELDRSLGLDRPTAANKEISPIKASPALDLVYRSHLVPGSASKQSRILTSNLPFSLVSNRGDGDCMLYALGATSEADADRMRTNIADFIGGHPDTPLQMSYNANQVTAMLLQTPQTRAMTQDLTFGRYSVPNRAYANLVKIPGIYLGVEELTAFSALEDNRGKKFLVVDRDETLTRIRNGERTTLSYTPESRSSVVAAAIGDADVALYKTPQHWQRIEKTLSA